VDGSVGWLKKLGAIDFAGGLVVHISSGTSALVAAHILGPRHHFPAEHVRNEERNVVLVMKGTAFLWLGWMGFNAGSAGAANTIAALALINTNTAASASFLTWVIIDYFNGRPIDLLGCCTAIVAGLVAITPAAGFVHPAWALLFGFSAALTLQFCTSRLRALPLDDSLEVFASHGCAGILGALLTGCCASKEVNPAGENGLFYGSAALLGAQFLAVLIVVCFCAGATAVLLLGLKYLGKIRVREEEERIGLDAAIHGESTVISPLMEGHGKGADESAIGVDMDAEEGLNIASEEDLDNSALPPLSA
jgi:Amt family ammonium transporter